MSHRKAPIVPAPATEDEVRTKLTFRLVFWVLFLAWAGATFVHLWKTRDPLYKNPLIVPLWTDYNIGRMSSRDPKAAAAGWYQVYLLYNKSWQAYYRILAHAEDDTPIHFRIRQATDYFSRGPQMSRFRLWPVPEAPRHDGERWGWPGVGHTIPFRCQTLGQAILAIAYDEGTWTKDFNGDWQRWWKANKWAYIPFPQVENPQPLRTGPR